MRKLAVVVGSLLIAVPAFAGIDFTGVTVDTADVYTAAGLVVSAIASIWAIKKVVKLLNRS